MICTARRLGGRHRLPQIRYSPPPAKPKPSSLRVLLLSGRMFMISRCPIAIPPDGRFLDRVPIRAMPCELHTVATGVLGAIKRLISHFQKSVEIGICPV